MTRDKPLSIKKAGVSVTVSLRGIVDKLVTDRLRRPFGTPDVTTLKSAPSLKALGKCS